MLFILYYTILYVIDYILYYIIIYYTILYVIDYTLYYIITYYTILLYIILYYSLLNTPTCLDLVCL